MSKVKKTADMREYMKQYYMDNKDEVFNKKYNCEICGGKYTHSNRNHHMKRKKHLSAIQNQKILDMERELVAQRKILEDLGVATASCHNGVNK